MSLDIDDTALESVLIARKYEAIALKADIYSLEIKNLKKELVLREIVLQNAKEKFIDLEEKYYLMKQNCISTAKIDSTIESALRNFRYAMRDMQVCKEQLDLTYQKFTNLMLCD